MNGAYIILGGGLLISLTLVVIVISQMSKRGEFDKPKSKNYYLGMGMALGMAVGIPVGLLTGIAMDRIALGISIGPAVGVAIGTSIGSVLEKKYNPHPAKTEDESSVSGKKAFTGIMAGLGLMVLTIVIIFILIN